MGAAHAMRRRTGDLNMMESVQEHRRVERESNGPRKRGAPRKAKDRTIASSIMHKLSFGTRLDAQLSQGSTTAKTGNG